MSKTRRNYTEDYEREDYGMDVDEYRRKKTERRYVKSLKNLDLEDLMHYEDDE